VAVALAIALAAAVAVPSLLERKTRPNHKKAHVWVRETQSEYNTQKKTKKTKKF
jgi:uncharacterized membrane protein YccC